MRRVTKLCHIDVKKGVRCFDASERIGKEYGFGHKMRDIPVLTGNPRPVSREEAWHCEYRLTDRMEEVIPAVLRKNNWSDVEIRREIDQIFERKITGSTASLNTWSTVEEFQRTPWYRRYKPSDSTPAKYISYEAMKLVEAALIPPSLRVDPYAHLRKRHLEDCWMNDKFSEDNARYITREKLAQQTKGMPTYGTITRKRFLEFDEKYRKASGNMQIHGSYMAWVRSTNENELPPNS